MPIKILIKNNEAGTCRDYWVHGEHERDLFDFLLAHEKKSEASTYGKEDVGWFLIDLLAKDIEPIKQTAWYANASWNRPYLEKELEDADEIEVFYVEYTPPKEE